MLSVCIRILSNIYSNSPGVKAGLSVNDEIIAINGWRVNDKFESHDSKFGVNEGVEITYSRDGKIYTTKLQYIQSPMVAYKLTVADEDNKLLKAWLK